MHFLLMSTTRVTQRAVHSLPGREKWTHVPSTFQMVHVTLRIIIRKNSRGVSFSFFLGVQLLFSGVPVSAGQRGESPTRIHMVHLP